MPDPTHQRPAPLVAAVGQAMGHPVADWQALHGGRTNALWRVETADGPFAVKLYRSHAATPLFPNDPHAELAVLTALADRHLAPEPYQLLQGDFGTALIYAFVDGVTWGGDTAALATLLDRVHNSAAPDGIRTLASGSAALMEQARLILSDCRPSPEVITRTLADLENQTPVPSSSSKALIHCDPVASNVIETPNGLTLIDWQCPAIGDPCEDLAIVLSPSMQQAYLGRRLSDADQAAFLDSYPDQAIASRYQKLAPFFHARMAAYAWWCLSTGRGATQQDVADEIDAARRAQSC